MNPNYNQPPRHGDRGRMSPPNKRMRSDYGSGDRGNYNSNYLGGPSYQQAGWGSGQERTGDKSGIPGGPTEPPQMTFKQFLASQEDTIDDKEAIAKYNDYKVEFKKQQLSEFFLAHKDEDWFKERYHPDNFASRNKQQCEYVINRLEVFKYLLTNDWIDESKISMDINKSERLIKLMDAAVILMEGGTELDLKSLDEEKTTASASPTKPPAITLPKFAPPVERKDEMQAKVDVAAAMVGVTNGPSVAQKTTADEEKKDGNEEQKDDANKSKGKEESEPMEPGEDDEGEKEDHDPLTSDEEGDIKMEEKKEAEEEENKMEEEVKEKGGDSEQLKTDDDKKTDVEAAENEKQDIETNEEKMNGVSDAKPIAPRALHKTSSIFMRTIPTTVSREELEMVCKRYPGFIRLVFADPQPERKFARRAWAIFERSVNIKDICWKLNTVRIQDSEMLGPIVNRDLQRRVRFVNGIAAHPAVVRNDIKNCAKIIQNLDDFTKLWDLPDNQLNDPSKPNLGFESKNPLLTNITEYLVEEGSAEEEELLGMEIDSTGNVKSKGKEKLERDETLLVVLDRLLLYLRIVYSFDYYNAIDYPNEDEMPNRCGLLHVRGIPAAMENVEREIKEWMNPLNTKLEPYLNAKLVVSKDEAEKLGKKDADAEIEKFIVSNTQELAKDKWLCTLSGKKFKGPEFVRKHITNKHEEQLISVRNDVSYFNNYLMDPKRPHLPPHPGGAQAAIERYGSSYQTHNPQHGSSQQQRHQQEGVRPPYQDSQSSNYSGNRGGSNYHQGSSGGGGGGGFNDSSHYEPRPRPRYNDDYNSRRGGGNFYGNRPGGGGGGSGNIGHDRTRSEPSYRGGAGGGYRGGRGGGRTDPRGIVNYRDLDVPEDTDIF